MRLRGRRMAMNGWVGMVADRRYALTIMGRASSALRHRGRRMALNSWIYLVDERTRARILCNRAADELRGTGLRRGLLRWRENGADRKKVGGVLRSLNPKGRAMRRALNSWREMATNRRTALKLMRRAGAALRGRGIRMAMNGWAERRQRRRANLDSVRRSMAAWRHRGTHNLHFHHYCMGAALLPLMPRPEAHALAFGVFVEGVATWGMDPILVLSTVARRSG